MTKRAHSLLFTLFFLLLGTSAAWGQTTINESSTINFTPNPGITSSSWTFEETYLDAPFISSISTTFVFQEGNVNGAKGKYRVVNGAAEFGYNNDNDGRTLITITLDNLVPNRQYTFTLNGKISGQDMQLKRGFSGVSNLSGPEWPSFGTSVQSRPHEWTFTAKTTQATVTFAYNASYNNKGSQTFYFTHIGISGPCTKMVTSSQGFEVCAGETTKLTAVGLSAPITWEECNPGETTWTPITGETGVTMDVLVLETKHYRAKKGTEILYTQKTTSAGTTTNVAISPVVCCAKAGDLIPIFTESFDLENDNIIKLMSANRAKFQDAVEDDITDYNYASGTFPPDSYAILKVPSQGGHWTSSHITGGNTQRPVEDGGMGQNPAKDGFFLADCGKDSKVIFTYTIDDNALCSNTVYDFSAFICNVDNTSGQAPVNATLSVVGIGNNGTNTFFDIPTGDLNPGSPWQRFGRSFNSGDYTKFIVTIKNNYEGTESTVVGNDIGVDDITFSACRPEIQIYSDNAYKPVVTVCGQGNNVPVLLEALAVYDLTEFFSTPYYHFQFKNPEGQWESAGPTDLRDNITISVDPSRYSDGMEYRVWVGATEQAVNESVRTGLPGTGCNALTAVSDPITITYHCDCQASPEPTVENYFECPSTTKLDLNTLITNRSTTGTYTWYTSNAENAPALSATEAQNIDVSQYNQTNPTRTYYVSYDQDGSAVETYCPSPKVKVEVTVKKIYDIVNNIIPGDLCRSFLPYEDKLWVNERIVDPT
ncbi:MAG: hypothetical protein J6V62_01035, partial [Paludibacteraceae bacterium]|nr:hypothetical protein [Paludibacteraceae bacterium]